MRGLMFSAITGIALMASGVLLANIASGDSAAGKDELRGSVAKFYSSDTILLDNHRYVIRLADIPAPGRNFAEEAKRIERLTELVGGADVRCTKIAVDGYGLDLAQCWNHQGESLNQALAAFAG